MLNTSDILETIRMITDENLDVRTVTMGISLLDCVDPDPRKACENIYRKITTQASRLVEVVDGIRNHTGSNRASSLEGRVVALSDRIAYVCHDIDDAERAGLLTEHDLPSEPRSVLGDTSSERIETMVHDVVTQSARAGDISMSEPIWNAMMSLRTFLFENLYSRGDAKWEEPKAYAMLGELFDHFVTHLDEVPAEYRLHDEDRPDLQVADFVSGMTDRYAVSVYESLKVPRSWRRR